MARPGTLGTLALSDTSRWLIASEAAWPQCKTFLSQHPCAILPLGATEQHGPHLPQNTDTVIAEALAKSVVERTRGLVLPSIPIGYSWAWRDYPGSLTFSTDTFQSVVKDVARTLDRQGCKQLMLLSAHGANVQPMKYAARELVDELGLQILRVFYPDLSEVMADAESEAWLPMNFHAEEFETSVMLHLRPELVDMSKAAREYPPRSIGYEMSSVPMGELSESGVFGDATVASADKGERWFAACVEKIASIWNEFLGDV